MLLRPEEGHQHLREPRPQLGPVIFVGGWAIAQHWLFWVVPLLGATLAGLAYRWVGKES